MSIVTTVGTTVAGTLAKIAAIPSPASPFLAIGAGLTELAAAIMSVLGVGEGCGWTCIQASKYADQIEAYLKQNRDQWLSLPRDLQTTDNYNLAINNFQAGIVQLQQLCGNPNLGDAGRRCISERTRGGKWDWYSYYLDPIQNTVPVDQTTGGSSLIANASNLFGSNLSLGLLIGIGILVIGMSD